MKCEKCGKQHDGSFGSGRFCSKSCANSRVFSKTSKLKKSKANKGMVPWNKGKICLIEKICLTCKHKFYAKLWGRKTCSIECETHAPGRNGGYRSNSTRKIRSEYKGYWMDSGSERKFAELMDDNKIEWVKNTTEYFRYTDKEGKSRKYYPDFYLPAYNYWVEIKGRWYKNENDDLKLKSVGTNIELQFHNEIRLPKIIAGVV